MVKEYGDDGDDGAEFGTFLYLIRDWTHNQNTGMRNDLFEKHLVSCRMIDSDFSITTIDRRLNKPYRSTKTCWAS